MNSIESRLNFSQTENIRGIELKAGESESYYQKEFNKYCEENRIDSSEDNCSAMIMAGYGSENETFWFWIDEE